VTAAIVIAAMALGVFAGLWQWNRHHEKAAAIAAQEAAQGSGVTTLDEVLDPGASEVGDAEWHIVEVTGTFADSPLTELRGRSLDRVATLQYLAWLTLDDGRSLLVNTGWQARSAEASAPELPRGTVTVTGVLRNFEQDNGRQTGRITPAQVPQPGGQMVPGYVMAESICGAQGCFEQLEPVPVPSISLGAHLSYAFQWWLLTLVAAPIAIWVTRKDAAHERERDAQGGGATGSGAQKPARTPRPARRRERGPSDEEIEDAL
jgi:cytochrome oxidase assembly protein ShyY1